MRRKKLLIYIAALIVLLLIVLGINFHILSSRLITKERVQATLSEFIGQSVMIDRVKLRIWQGLEIYGLRLPGVSGEPDLLKAQKVNITYDKTQLLSGRLALKQIEIVSPELYIGASLPKRSPAKPTEIKSLPYIVIKQGRLRLGHSGFLKEGCIQTLENVRLDLYPFAKTNYKIEGQADAKDLGRWLITGEMNVKEQDFRVTFITKDISLGESIATKLSPQLRKTWDRYCPQGQVKLGINLTHKPDAIPPLDFTVILDCQDAEMTYLQFPYKVFNIKGKIEILKEGARLINLNGRNGATNVSLSGKTIGYDKHAGFEIKIDIKNLSFDKRLYEALPKPIKKVWERLNPQGMVDANCYITRETGIDKKVNYDIRLQCRDCNFVFDQFPYPLNGASGEIVYKNGETTIKSLVARHDKAEVKIDGVLDKGGEKGRVDIVIEAKDVELSDYALKEAFNNLVTGGDKLWENHLPEGPADFQIMLQKTSQHQPMEAQVIMDCKKDNFKYGPEKYPLNEVTGQIVYHSKTKKIKGPRVLFQHLLARNEKSQFEIDGEIVNPTMSGNSKATPQEYSVKIKAKNLIINPVLEHLLPESLAQFIHELTPAGVLDLALDIKQHTQSTPVLNYSAELKLTDGTMNPGFALTEMNGTIKIIGERTSQWHHLKGSVGFSHLRAENKRFENVSITFSQEGNRFSFYKIDGSAYQGRVSGNFYITLPEYNYIGHLSLAGIDLKDFSRDTFVAGKDISGKLAVELDFKGLGEDINTLTGQGRLFITEAQLWEVPLFLSIFNAFSLKKKSVFKEGIVKARIENGKIIIRRAVFTSPSLILKGEGHIKLKNGKLDLLFKTETKSLIKIIVDPIVNVIYAIKIGGTFKEPSPGIIVLPSLHGSPKDK